ncbi:MAG: SLBB domain-containing protein [Gemmatimonadota bacterium]
MNIRKGLLCAAFTALIGTPSMAGAQVTPPSPATAQKLAQERPEVMAQLVSKLQSSGLTNEQIRSRLKAQGYAETLLDVYLPGGNRNAPPPSAAEAQKALQSLGLNETSTVTTPTAPEIATVTSVPAAEAGLTAGVPIQQGGLGVFGVEIFRRTTTQFDPVLAGPVDANYRVGPRDVLQLTLTGGIEATYQMEVSREGSVNIPKVGEVAVTNLNLDQVRDLLYIRLGRVYSGVRRSSDATTFFTLTVSKLRANQVFVLGDVTVPGSFTISSVGTALTALYAAGGPTINGSMRLIEVRRAGKVVSTLDLYDYLLRGDATKDIRLENNDIVFVPSNPKHAAITGEIMRPAIYELKDGETLAELVAYAGGFKSTAARRRLEITRILPPEQRPNGGRDRVVLDVEGPELNLGSAPRTPLLTGDQVVVFGVTSPVRDQITIGGGVWAPGNLGFRPGMTLSEAIRKAGGVKGDAYLGEIHITRQLPDQRTEVVRSRLSDTLGTVDPDVVLKDGDEVRIFSVTEFRTTRTISLTGAVRRPVGPIAYQNGITLRDLLVLAGGVRGDAYLGEIQITRVLPDQRTEIVRSRLSDTLGTVNPNVVLKEGDQVHVFSVEEFRTTRTVTLAGKVRRAVTGPYQVGTTFRDLMQLAGGVEDGSDPMDTVEVTRLQPDLTNRSFRIALRDASGAYNSFAVQPGDVFTVHARSEFRTERTVTVGGAVKAGSVTIPFAEGLTLRQAIIAAGGLTESAYLVEVEISRRPPSHEGGTLAKVFRVPLDSTYILERGPDGKYLGPPGIATPASGAPEVTLQPYDHVSVLTQPEWYVGGTVTIMGEVKFPSTYSIKNRNERISDLIAHAGGLTERAFTDGAIFRRESAAMDASDRQRLLQGVMLDRSYSLAIERINAAARMASTPAAAAVGATGAVTAAVSAEETALQGALNFGEGQNRVAIDLSEALRHQNHSDNLLLKAGDILIIPMANPTVTVRGFVNAPVTLPYRPGASIDDYIAGAGGLTQNADPHGAFVQQPNGRVETYRHHRLLPDEVPTPGPGSVIIVPPREVKIEGGIAWGTIFQGLGTFATALAAIISLSR